MYMHVHIYIHIYIHMYIYNVCVYAYIQWICNGCVYIYAAGCTAYPSPHFGVKSCGAIDKPTFKPSLYSLTYPLAYPLVSPWIWYLRMSCLPALQVY